MISLSLEYIVIICIIVWLCVYLVSRKKEKKIKSIRDYLLTDDDDLENESKPIMWIHMPYEYNTRNWENFGSRSSYDINQPYIFLLIRTIIDHCDDSFRVVLFDDGTFNKLLPDWNVNVYSLADPIKSNMRMIGMLKLLKMYGGMVVPVSFLCLKDLRSLYETGIRNEKMFVSENINRTINSTHEMYEYSINMMGSEKENEEIIDLIDYMTHVVSSDQTENARFVGKVNEWCKRKYKHGKINVINGRNIGVITRENTPVTIDELFGEGQIKFEKEMYGINVPMNEILGRTKYEWFVRMSPEQIFESKFQLAKYISYGLERSEQTKIKNNDKNKERTWVGFWRVPMGSGNVNLFGLKPTNLI